jgi:tetratricopeptide (TPR) repeat protein
MRISRRMLAILVVGALGLAMTGCSDDGEPSAPTLEAALQAHQEGRLDEAVDLYKAVIVEEPDNKFAWYNLGLIHQTRGQKNLAETEYRRALETDAEFVPALFNLAIIRVDRDDLTEAIELYQSVIELQPEFAAAHLNLGFALIEAGDAEAGQEELDRAVELDPTLAARLPEGSALSPEPPSGQGGDPSPS